MLRRVVALAAWLPACGPTPDHDAAYEDIVTLDVAIDHAPVDDDIDGPVSTHVSPLPHPDFTFVLPEGAPEQTATFTVTASAGRVDLHLLIDSTGSFRPEIGALRMTLTHTILPALRVRIPSLTIGVSSFEDFPFPPFGVATDRPFVLYVQQTSDANLVDVGVNGIYQGDGGDTPEAWPEALYQCATGAGLISMGRVLIPRFVPHTLPDSGALGGVGFRAQSTRVLVLITDAPGHMPMDYAGVVNGVHSIDQSVMALNALGVHVVGIAASSDARVAELPVATATGAIGDPIGGVCRTGLNGQAMPTVAGRCPLVFDLAPDGTGLSTTIVESLTELLDSAIYGDVHGEADDPNGFVTAIEAVSANPPGPRVDQFPLGHPDGIPDTFVNVHANTQLTFRLHVRNVTVADGEFPQVFYLPVRVLGDGSVLRELTVRVIVPEGPKFDGGE